MPGAPRCSAGMCVVLLALLSLSTGVAGFTVSSARLPLSLSHRGMAQGRSSLRMAAYNSKDVNANWAKPDAAGTFGRVFFGSQGLMGMGGQVVVKVPVDDWFAQNVFTTEQIVNEKLKAQFGNKGRWAEYLGDMSFEPGTLPAGDKLGSTGLVFRKENGETMEDILFNRQDLSSKIGAAKDSGLIRPNLACTVMGELLVASQQMHSVGVMHRDIKPENILVTGGPQPLKLIDFGASCDVTSGQGVADMSLDPTYAPPERKIQPKMPGKYDVYCVGMVGMRCLFPSFSKDPRPGVSERVKGNTSLMMCFAEVDFPRGGHKLEKWGETVMRERDPTMKAEVDALFSGGNEELISLMNGMLDKQVVARKDAAQALSLLGPQWASKV